LVLAAQLDGFQGNEILAWKAAWMTETLSESPELARAIKILNARNGEL
jgi:hypothetical protein